MGEARTEVTDTTSIFQGFMDMFRSKRPGNGKEIMAFLSSKTGKDVLRSLSAKHQNEIRAEMIRFCGDGI